MRRKDRERDEIFAWEVLKKAPYATLSMSDEQGQPYAVPLCQAVDPDYRRIYVHCAGAGRKWELLREGREVCLTAVSHATAVPNSFTMAYASAVVRGRAEVVTEDGEKTRALLLLCESFDPKGMARFASYMDKMGAITQMIRITPYELSGKENAGG